MAIAMDQPYAGICRCASLRLQVAELSDRLQESRAAQFDLQRRYQMLLAKRSLAGRLPLMSGAELDAARCEVRRGDRAVSVPQGQWRFLEQLATEGRQDIRAQAMSYYGCAGDAELSSLRVLAGRLRRTLRPVGADADIVTTGSGYVLARPQAQPAPHASGGQP